MEPKVEIKKGVYNAVGTLIVFGAVAVVVCTLAAVERKARPQSASSDGCGCGGACGGK